MTTEKFLKFKGKRITLIDKEGDFYVVLKPICEILEIDWENETKKISNHPLYNSVASNLEATGADGKQYEMVCTSLNLILLKMIIYE